MTILLIFPSSIDGWVLEQHEKGDGINSSGGGVAFSAIAHESDERRISVFLSNCSLSVIH
jgi:hypothetical protein